MTKKRSIEIFLGNVQWWIFLKTCSDLWSNFGTWK